MVRTTALALSLVALTAVSAVAEDPAPDEETPDAPPKQTTPHHPGSIDWKTDLASAQAASAEDGRPVLAYFTFDT